ncbi:MAG: hypothetical protein J7J80_04270 [Thermotogae bacterium]|nr:hypothetical protein [Thermotogota bacterium]
MREELKRISTILFLTVSVLLAFFYLPWRFSVDKINNVVAIALWGRVVNHDFLQVGEDVVFARDPSDVLKDAAIVIPIATNTSVLEEIVRKSIEINKKVGILEFYENEALLKKTARNYPLSSFLRVHRMKPTEYAGYNPRSLRQRLVRAVRERSVDLILLPPPPKKWGFSYPELALDIYYSIVKEARYTTLPAFHPVKLPVWMKLVAWVGLFGVYASINVGYVIVAIVLSFLGNWGRSLSIIFATVLLYRTFKNSKWFLRYLSYVPLAVVTSSIFASPAYVAGIQEFRGVKLSLIALPALITLKALIVERPKRFERSDLIIVVLLAVAGVYYLFRSGNYGFAPAFEVRVRDFLDAALYARPRTKEIVGFAAAVLMDLNPRLRSTKWGFIFEILVAVGMVSVINTFCHFKGPIFVHLVRTLNGLWTGGFVALLITGVWSLWVGKSY